MTKNRKTLLALILAVGFWMQVSAEVYATSMLGRNIDELTYLSENIVVGSVVTV